MATTNSPATPSPSFFRQVAPLTQSLWHLYLAFLTWILMPLFAVAAPVYPLTDGDYRQIAVVAVIAVIPLGLWSGLRGGPLMLSETDVLYGLIGRTGFLIGLGAISRQVITIGALGTMTSCLLYILSADQFTFGRYLAVSGAGLALGCLTVAISLVVSPSIRWGKGSALPRPRRDRAWERALALTEVRIASNLLDMRGALVSLRHVRDGDRRARVRFQSMAGFGPLARPVVSLAALPSIALFRIATLVGVTAVLLAVTDGRARTLLVGFTLFAMAIDATGSLAAAVDGQAVLRGSPVRMVLLATELVMALGLCLLLALLAWLPSRLFTDHLSIGPLLILAVGSVLAASVQARLGAPNLDGVVAYLPPDQMGGVLAMRSVVALVPWLGSIVLTGAAAVDGPGTIGPVLPVVAVLAAAMLVFIVMPSGRR